MFRIPFAILAILLFAASCEGNDPGQDRMFSRAKILNKVNRARQAGQKCGDTWYPAAGKLKYNEKLEAAAKVQSDDMFKMNKLSHEGSDKSHVDDRLNAQQYFWQACGENVAYGVLYEDEVIDAWIKSEGHCVNIMNPKFTEMGAWITGLYYTLVLAKPESH